VDFNEHAFISYRKRDNDSEGEGEPGWVDKFEQHLKRALAELIIADPRIWRDPRLPGNAHLVDYLRDRLRESLAFVAILSPGYLGSKWCLGELDEFYRLASKSGGVEVRGRYRLFKVTRTRLEGKHPKQLRDEIGYKFYEVEKGNQRPREFGQETGPNKDQRYWDKLRDLAWDLKELIKAVRPQDVVAGRRPRVPSRMGRRRT
jgi:hypothetical protein